MSSTLPAQDSNSELQIGFGRFRFEVHSSSLYRDDLPVRLRPQASIALRTLLSRPGELVSREVLIAAIWGDTVVEYDPALNVALGEVRTALGDRASRPTFIETVRGEGYRFVAETVAVQPTTPPHPLTPKSAGLEKSRGKRKWIWVGLASLTFILIGLITSLVAKTPTTQVEDESVRLLLLPFTAGEGAEISADILFDELLHNLSQVPGQGFETLTALPLATSEFNREGAKAARNTGATHLVTGSVVKSASGNWNVTSRLVRTRDGRQLWSGHHEPLNVGRDSPSQLIAEGIRNALGRPAIAPPPSPVPADRASTRANDYYLRARNLYGNFNPAEVRDALDLVSRSLESDDTRAEAWSLRGSLLVELALSADDPEVFAQAEDAAQRALELSPELPEAHLLEAQLALYGDWNASSAIAWADKAEALRAEPFLLEDTRLRIALALGDMQGVLHWSERGRARDPRRRSVAMTAFSAYLATGQPTRAFDTINQGVLVGLPESDQQWLRLIVSEYSGRTEEASRLSLQILEGIGAEELASRFHTLSPEDRLLALHEHRLASLYRRREEVSAVILAIGHARAGQGRFAIDWLEQAVEARLPSTLVMLHFEPSFHLLATNPRFVELGQRVQDLLK